MIKLYPIAKELLREVGSVAKIKKTFEIIYDLQMTAHAEERQLRHLDSNGEIISTKEITQLIDLAIPQLTNALIQNTLDIGDKIVLIKNNLNSVGQLHNISPGQLKFVIITVMKEKNFRTNPENKIFRF